MAWHEEIIKELSDTMRRVDKEIELIAKIDSYILASDRNLNTILEAICSELRDLVIASHIEIAVLSGQELIPMGFDKGSSSWTSDFIQSQRQFIESQEEYVKAPASTEVEVLHCFKIPFDGQANGLLIVGQNTMTPSNCNEAQFTGMSRLFSHQIAMLMKKYTEERESQAQKRMMELFFNSNLQPTICWHQIVENVHMFLPDWMPLRITPPPKVQLLSYKDKDRYLKIIGTQGDEEIGTDVLVDSSITGLLIGNSALTEINVDPSIEYRQRYKGFLLETEAEIPRSELAIPIRHEGEGNIICIVNLEHSRKGVFKSQHVEAIKRAARFLAPFIHALQVRQQEQRHKEIAEHYTMSKLLGRIAAAYQHDLGHPIVNIRLTLEDLGNELGHEADRVQDRFNAIYDQIQIIGESSDRFCENLPMFIKSGPIHVRNAINNAVAISNIMKLKNDENIDIVINIASDVNLVYASKMLQEHIYNLLSNSVFAVRQALTQRLTDNGIISIDVFRREIKDKLDQKTASIQVVFCIKDNGIGVFEKDKSMIGQPGFTTKGDQGSGYGVAAAIQYMHDFGGHLITGDAPPRGFMVEFYLEEFDDMKHVREV